MERLARKYRKSEADVIRTSLEKIDFQLRKNKEQIL